MNPQQLFNLLLLLFASSFVGVCDGLTNLDNPFSEPGVLIGLIVGIVGVLVIVGVTIVLCRIFCCKKEGLLAEFEGTSRDEVVESAELQPFTEKGGKHSRRREERYPTSQF